MRTSRYLDEIIDYGGHPFTRAEVILDMQSIGADQSCIDRWLQGHEFAQRLRERSAEITTKIFLADESRRPRKLCR
jgi:hypothetical protein